MGVHSHDPFTADKYTEKIKATLSDGVWEELKALHDKPGKPNLAEVEAELDSQIDYYTKLERRNG